MLSSLNVMQPENKRPVTSGTFHADYTATGYFSKIVTDYLAGDRTLEPFYKYTPDIEGIKKALTDRSGYAYKREILVKELRKQYEGLDITDKVASNLALLLNENTFTITTAHQPNIFTGPLYFIYKILHAIRLSSILGDQIPSHRFVPVFFMGSEDADIEELNHFELDGKRYVWNTVQSGAVGRMKVDKAFVQLLNDLKGQLGVLPYGEEIISIFRSCYIEGETVQQCTLKLVNSLFGEFGLVVLIPDNPELKRLFVPVVEQELKSQFSHKEVERVAAELSKHYKVQAGGRELNLFYLLDNKRERIEVQYSKVDAQAGQPLFTIPKLDLQFSETEILHELQQYPERFSPNVILRGVFQELILPNVAFIGGGGEIAYWLELKKVFEGANVPYPVLVLRNSFLLVPRRVGEDFKELGFDLHDVFKTEEELINELVKRDSSRQLSLSEEKGELNSYYQQLHELAFSIDSTLGDHVSMLQAKALKRICELEKKILRAEKRKFEAEKRKIGKIKSLLFPKGGLQERTENISGYYARVGKDIIQEIAKHSPGLEQEFTVITI